ncbi:hypothetical protein COI63_19340 [Bacillus toyonensis]|nr:hypothetical protein COI63_19340 [Bacillus toyonensis]
MRPSWIVKTFIVLACQPARESLKIEGLGSSIDGVKGKSSPCRFGQSPRSFFAMQAWLGEAKEPRRARPNINLV